MPKIHLSGINNEFSVEDHKINMGAAEEEKLIKPTK